MPFKVTVPPTAEIFSAKDLRLHLGLGAGETEWDDLINDYIAAARAKAESYTRKVFISQTVVATFDNFGSGTLYLPVGPTQSVDKLEYRAPDGEWQEITSARYRAYLENSPGCLQPIPGGNWPIIALEPESVRVTYQAGFGANRTSVHPDILQAVRLMVADAFENRGDEGRKPFPRRIHSGAEDFLSGHREWF